MSVSREARTPAGSVADGSTPAKTPAVKDRECPYCHEVFTSSSLGRHLDQFIKEDKPKPPDGKHNVEEIQRLRGSVTRRQARTSSVKRDSSAVGLQGSISHNREEASPPAKRARTNGTAGSRIISFNKPNWLSTGVISDLSASGDQLLPALSGITRSEIEAKEKLAIAERDEGRAAKLALTEVLDNIKASLSNPYPFDFLAQSFPSLVLLILPRQATITSAQLIPSPNCWPIDPPGEAQLTLIQQKLAVRLDEFQRDQRARRARNISEESTRSDSTVESSARSDFSAYREHLDAAYKHWSAQPEQERTRQWHLASLRAYALEQEAHAETQEKLAKSEQIRAHQAAQIKRLSTLQQPQEFLVSVPMASPLPRDAARAVANSLGAESLAADALIAKWKPSVRNNRGFQRGFFSGVFETAAAAADGIGLSGNNHDGADIDPNHVDGDGDHDMIDNGITTNGTDVHPLNGSHNPSPTQAVRPLSISVATPNHKNNSTQSNSALHSALPNLEPTLNNSSNNQDADADNDGDSVDASGEDDDDIVSTTQQPPSTNNTSKVLRKVSSSTPLPPLDQGVLDPSLRGEDRDGGVDFGADTLTAPPAGMNAAVPITIKADSGASTPTAPGVGGGGRRPRKPR